MIAKMHQSKIGKCLTAATLGAALIAQGCAQMIPARSWELDEGLYKLEASGNIFASNESLQEKVDKKAAKICGEAGFTYVEDTGVVMQNETTYTNGYSVDASYKVLTKTVKCN